MRTYVYRRLRTTRPVPSSCFVYLRAAVRDGLGHRPRGAPSDNTGYLSLESSGATAAVASALEAWIYDNLTRAKPDGDHGPALQLPLNLSTRGGAVASPHRAPTRLRLPAMPRDTRRARPPAREGSPTTLASRDDVAGRMQLSVCRTMAWLQTTSAANVTSITGEKPASSVKRRSRTPAPARR
jgi:hypothetical protein